MMKICRLIKVSRMTEIWRVTEEYPFIEVSNMGRVRKKDTVQVVPSSHKGVMMTRHDKAKELTPTDNGNGYKIISVRIGGKRENAYLHRLVAMAFVPGYEEGLVVDHINHDRSDNRADNLAWVSQKENVRRSVHLMQKPKCNCRPTNTGEKYISKVKVRHGNGYRYRVRDRRTFHTLEEAVAYRNEVMGW